MYIYFFSFDALTTFVFFLRHSQNSKFWTGYFDFELFNYVAFTESNTAEFLKKDSFAFRRIYVHLLILNKLSRSRIGTGSAFFQCAILEMCELFDWMSKATSELLIDRIDNQITWMHADVR